MAVKTWSKGKRERADGGDEEEVRGQETKMLVTSVTPELEDLTLGLCSFSRLGLRRR
jgi:hypothetical protein